MNLYCLLSKNRKHILPRVSSWKPPWKLPCKSPRIPLWKSPGKLRQSFIFVLLLIGVFLLTGCAGDPGLKTPAREPLPQAEPEEEEIGVVKVEGGMMLERDIIPQLCAIFSLSAEEVKGKLADVKAMDLISPELTGFRRMEGIIPSGEYQIFRGDDLDGTLSVWLTEAEDRYKKLASKTNGGNGLTAGEHLIMASVIEGECLGATRQKEVAAVLLTRLAIDSKLQCCATTEYALGFQRPYLTLKDIEIESDYNTYYVPGLPVGPICSVSDASLEAAISQKADYKHYYFYYDFVLKDVFFFADYTTFLEGAKASKQRFDANSSVRRHDKINKQALYLK